MLTQFKGKSISAIYSVLPAHSVDFMDEVGNYSFTEAQMKKLKKVMGFGTRRVAQEGETVGDYAIHGIEQMLKDGIFKEIFNHANKLYKSHDKIDDTTVVDEYYCYFRGDTTLRIGCDYDCQEHLDVKNDIYTSVGEVIDFVSIDHLSTSIFEIGWSPDSVSKEDCTLTLKVK